MSLQIRSLRGWLANGAWKSSRLCFRARSRISSRGGASSGLLPLTLSGSSADSRSLGRRARADLAAACHTVEAGEAAGEAMTRTRHGAGAHPVSRLTSLDSDHLPLLALCGCHGLRSCCTTIRTAPPPTRRRELRLERRRRPGPCCSARASLSD
eukprot:30497-Pelagococcus_subviridis.AAC.44